MVNTIKIIIIFLIYFEICLADNELECYSCNSGNDDEINCAIKPDEHLPKKMCKEKEQCFVAIDDKQNTIRGCGSETFKPSYHTCKTSLCNGKIYPNPRLQCFKCSGKDCVSLPLDEKPEICRKYSDTNICYTNVIDETEAIRGCKSDLDPTTPIDFHKSCKGTGCNKENGILTVTCSVCDSKKDNDCKRADANPCKILNKVTCQVSYLLGRPAESCFTYHHLEHVIRGCTINSAKLPLVEKEFKTCKGNLCNNECLKLENCATCGIPTADPYCTINEMKTCNLDQSSCFTCLKKNHTGMMRGCGEPPSDMNCQFCQEENNCNTKPLQKCYKCNSENQSSCSGFPHSGAIETEVCDSVNTQCLTIINANKFTERGCRSSQFNCTKQAVCIPCTGSYCNNDIIPSNRLKCHQCNSSLECSIKPEDGTEQPCIKYDEHDECFEFKLNLTHIVRGCKSDSDEFKKCEEIGGANCRKCNVEGCNRNIVSKKKSSLKCFKCNSLDPHCRWTQTFGNAQICNNVIDLNTTEHCFSLLNKNGTVLRGCSWDMNICMENTARCKICNEIGCNKDVITPQYCIQEVVIDGKDKNKNLIKTKCNANEQFLESEGCYVNRIKKTVTWGCAMDLPITELEECKKLTSTNCYYCYGVNCDKMRAPNGAIQSVILSTLLLFTSFMIHLIF